MNKKSKRSLKAAELENHPLMRELYHRAEAQLRKQRHTKSSAAPVPRWPTGPERLLHELQVHEIELELQNSELRQARDKLEVALENYTDLYDFAPVGYFTLAASGAIHRANLTGASLVGIERSRLVNRPFGQLVPAALRPAFNAFLKKVFASPAKQSLDVEILRPGQPSLAVNIEAQRLLNGEECRAAVMDITERKQAGVAQRRVEVLAASNHKLELEIVRRHAVEVSLKQSEQHQLRLLAESQRMQEQLRNLSRQVLLAQEVNANASAVNCTMSSPRR